MSSKEGGDGHIQGGEVPGIGHADSFAGPFRVLNPDPIFAAPAQFVSPNGTAGVGVFRGEDFFLWAGKRGLHLLWHVKQPFSTMTSTSFYARHLFLF